jgi:8-oxo-dGTP pyrophosphatase MutT (NUDIX family)
MAEPVRAAGILFVTPDHRALLMHRTDGKGWAFPGGVIEEGESAAAAAIREAFEETGHRVGGAALQPWIRTIRDGIDYTTFLVNVGEEFEPQLNDEHTDWTWAGIGNGSAGV